MRSRTYLHRLAKCSTDESRHDTCLDEFSYIACCYSVHVLKTHYCFCQATTCCLRADHRYNTLWYACGLPLQKMCACLPDCDACPSWLQLKYHLTHLRIMPCFILVTPHMHKCLIDTTSCSAQVKETILVVREYYHSSMSMRPCFSVCGAGITTETNLWLLHCPQMTFIRQIRHIQYMFKL